MTHERGGPAVIGCAALAVLAVEAAYVATRWDGLHSRFDRTFLFGIAMLAVVGLVLKALGLGRPVGPDRERARASARRTTRIFVLALLVSLGVASALGSQFGLVLGELAALACGFAIVCFREVAHPRERRPHGASG